MYKQILVDIYGQKSVFSQLCIIIYRQVAQRRRERLKQVQNGQVYDRTDKYKIAQTRVKIIIQNRIHRHFNRKKKKEKEKQKLNYLGMTDNVQV